MGRQLPSNARQQLRLFMQTRDPGDLADVTGTDLVGAYIFERELEALGPAPVDIGRLRQDLQLGSFSALSGSTSVLARPGASDILSAALESGAVGRKTDDKSLTFSLNALPLRQLLSGQVPRGCGSVDEDCRRGSGRWLRGLSASASVNTSSPTTDPCRRHRRGNRLAGFLVGSRKLRRFRVATSCSCANATTRSRRRRSTTRAGAPGTSRVHFSRPGGVSRDAWRRRWPNPDGRAATAQIWRRIWIARTPRGRAAEPLSDRV